jgi:surfactin synthase thioesterase subunit
MSTASGRCVTEQGNVEKADDVVVFLPPAGSIGSPYFPIGALLPAALPAVHCEMPGRGRLAHEKPPGSVHAAADRWATQLAETVPGRRLHFFGHSLGALFAYELALRFEAGHVGEVASLTVSGAREPGSTPRSLVATAFAALRKAPETPGAADGAEGAWLAEDLRIRREYRTGRQCLRAPLALLCGALDPFARPSEMEEWRQFTSGPYLGLFAFNGGHDYYLHGQEAVAQVIRRIVDAAGPPERTAVTTQETNGVSNAG